MTLKTLLRLLMLSILGWLALAACAPASISPASSSGVESVIGPSDDGGLYPPQDLSLITSTGRPQFINAYANW
ncbi:MAG: hypothetical protein JNM70_09655 [Anaerolineae bacterium]|nr:hypothetical protein [Anaerolineae bacterium]